MNERATFKELFFVTFTQESDRLKDDDLFKFLADLRRPTSLLKKLKCIPGEDKLKKNKLCASLLKHALLNKGRMTCLVNTAHKTPSAYIIAYISAYIIA